MLAAAAVSAVSATAAVCSCTAGPNVELGSVCVGSEVGSFPIPLDLVFGFWPPDSKLVLHTGAGTTQLSNQTFELAASDYTRQHPLPLNTKVMRSAGCRISTTNDTLFYAAVLPPKIHTDLFQLDWDSIVSLMSPRLPE